MKNNLHLTTFLNKKILYLFGLFFLYSCGAGTSNTVVSITDNIEFIGSGEYSNMIIFNIPDGKHQAVWGRHIASYYYDEDYLMAVEIPVLPANHKDSCNLVSNRKIYNSQSVVYNYCKIAFRLYDIKQNKDYGRLKLEYFLMTCDSLRIKNPIRKMGRSY